MIPEIKNPEDWHTVESILSKLMLNLPEFRHDYSKLVNNIEKKINELSKIDIQIRRQSTILNQRQRREKLKEINEMI